jgi:hypothetical protein
MVRGRGKEMLPTTVYEHVSVTHKIQMEFSIRARLAQEGLLALLRPTLLVQ